MKKFLFALSLLLVLGISANAYSQTKPDTTYNKAEVELIINEKATDIGKDIRAEIQEQEDRLWSKVDRELEGAKTQLEESRAILNGWFFVITVFLALVGIGAPIVVIRDLKSKHELALERIGKIKENAEEAKDEAVKAKGESEKAKYEIEKIRYDAEENKKNTERAKNQAEDNLRKIEAVHSDAEEYRGKLKTLAEIKSDQPLTDDQERVVEKVAADEDAPAKVRLLAKALKAQEEDRWEDAIKLWRALDILEPKDFRALFGIAYSIQELSNKTGKDEGLEEALVIYKELDNMNLPEYKTMLLNNSANLIFAQALNKDGREADSLFEEAYEKYKEATSIKPDYHEAFCNWGIALTNQAQTKGDDEAYNLYEEACKKYEKATEIKPDYYKAFSNGGIALTNQAQIKDGVEAGSLYEKACRKYEKATEIKPNDYESFINWGIALSKQALTKDGEEVDELFEKAWEKYEKAVAIKPDSYEAFYNWGIALTNQAHIKDEDEAYRLHEKAIEKYRRVIGIKQDHQNAFNHLGDALLTQAHINKGAKAEKLLEEAEEKCLKAEAIEEGFGSYNLACIAAVQGKGKDCKGWLEKARLHESFPGYKYVDEDKDFDNVRDEEWFKEFLKEGLKAEEAKKS